MTSHTETIIAALRVLARDIQSNDGIASAAIAEAADRLEELARDLEVTGKQLRQHELLIEENLRLKERIKRLEEHSSLLTEAGNEVFWSLCPSSPAMMTEREIDALKAWNKAKEAKP